MRKAVEQASVPRTWRDAVVTGAVAMAAFILLSLFPHELIHPSVCEEVAIAAGLRPPVAPFPGVYRLVSSLMLHIFPMDVGLAVLRLLGRLGIALATAGVYIVFRDLLPATFRLQVHMRRIGARVGNIVATAAALLFVCADPVWRAGQFFSPTTVFLVLAVAAVVLFFRFLMAGSIRSLYGCFALLGILSAETMLGVLFALLGVFGVLSAIRYAKYPDVPLVNPLVDQLVREVVFRRLSSVWAVFFMMTVAQNVTSFILAGGMEATGQEGVLGLLFAYFKGGCDGVRAAATGPGWFFGILLSIVPLLFSLLLLPNAWDDDRFLPYLVGIAYLILGVMALSQLSGWRVLEFWSWSNFQAMFSSDILLAFFLLLDVVAVAFALGVFGIDACCRNYRKIAQRRFPESVQLETPAQIAESLGKSRRFRRGLFWSFAVMVPLFALPGRRQLPEREVERVVSGYVDEVLDETDGCDTIFTDGSLDLYLELEARRRGRVLNCLSLLAPDTVRERLVRLRSAENEEDRVTLACDSVSALRAWLDARSGRLDRSAVQLGLELWRKGDRQMPPLSGLVARPGGLSEQERSRALKACRTLGDTAYRLADEGIEMLADPLLRRAFSFVLWRLARMAQMRSRTADLAGRHDEAIREAAVSDELDAVNPSVAGLRRSKVWQERQNSGVLTPREGLVIGLARADFVLAGRYAAPILAADPDDPRANFAMGMMYYADEQYTRSERHLLRCLVRRPDDAAVLNNLALVQMKIGKLDEAENSARKAVERLPGSPEAKRTLEKIQQLKSKAKRRS